MVKLTKIYTRGGDEGETSLVGGARRRKHDPRLEAIGTIDEANAAIGVARNYLQGAAGEVLGRVQNDLFDLGADLATPQGGDDANPALRITPTQTERLEQDIDRINNNLDPLTSFVLPGGSEAAGHMHLARTIVRRAERRIVGLSEKEPINPETLRYINRLSDLLFVLARHLNDDGTTDVLWVPGANRES